MAFRKIFLYVNPDMAAPVPADSPSTQIGLISKLPVYYFGETVIFCISLVDSQGNAVPYLNSDTFEMSVDNNFLHNDDLMAHTEGKADGTDSKVNVPGDWSEVSAANGKLSVRVDFNTISYEAKIGGSEFIQVRTEIKKFDAGSEDPAILMQSLSTARNVVNGGEGEPEEADPNYLTAAQTRALAAAEAGNLWKTGEGSPTYTDEKIGDMYLNTVNGAVYQVQNTSGGIEYTSVGNLTGPAGPPGSDGSQGPAGSDGATPVLSGGIVTTLPAGTPAAAVLVSSGANTYYLHLGLPQGEPGSDGCLSQIQVYDPTSAYSAMTCLAYNGGGYQVLEDTSAGETPDNASSKFVCFASAGGIPDFQVIHEGGSSIVPMVNHAYRVPLSSGTSISINSSGLTSSICVTQELWLDMPSTPVVFTLPTFTWVDGAVPDFAFGNRRYVITVRWDGEDFLANLAIDYAKVFA